LTASAPDGTTSVAQTKLLPSRRFLGFVLSLYVRLVKATSRIVPVPTDVYERYLPLGPTIYIAWHGNAMAMPLFYHPDMGEVVCLASPHPDGQIAAACVNALGHRTILGTGASEKAVHGTGGMAAFRALMRELEAGHSVFLTAEVPPKRGRPVSKGIVALARMSGRPIVTASAASSHRSILERVWDKMQINHPFGRVALIVQGPVMVDESVTDEQALAQLKQMLDEGYERAFRLADQRG